MDIEEKTFPVKLKVTSKGFDIYRFIIVQYFISSESGRMIVFQFQTYYFSGLTKDLYIIYQQDVHTSEGNKGTFIDCFHDDNVSYEELKLK